MSTPAGLYSRLRSSRSFRLVSLLPAKLSDKVHVELSDRELDSWLGRYSTVSYCWGNQHDRTEILINKQPSVVPASSAAALRRIRDDERVTTLWIDAICIDQTNTEERSQQVGLMKDIYANAHQNFIYLGEDDAKEAIASIQRVAKDIRPEFWNGYAKMRHVSHKMLESNFDARALRRFLTHGWFRRLWTFQECILARKNVVLCGPDSISLKRVTSTSAFMYEHWRFLPPDQQIPGLQVALGSVASLFNAMSSVRRKSRKQEIQPDEQHGAHELVAIHPSLDFLGYLDATSHRISSIPADKVYGVLALGAYLHIKADYKRAAPEVCLEVACKIAHQQRKLNFLRDVEYYKRPDDMFARQTPSWVPNWHRTFAREGQLKKLGYWYKADGGASHVPKAGNDRELLVRGFRAAVVSKTADLDSSSGYVSFALDHILALASDAAQRSGSSDEHTQMDIAHTLCGGRDYSQGRTDSSVLAKYRHFLNVISSELSYLDELWDSDRTESDLNLARSYWETLQIMWIKRKFFITQEGRLGLGPETMIPGDLVAVVSGLEWPAILRSVNGKWLFIGLAYAHGIMDGEAVTEHQRCGNASDEFLLI